MAVQAWPFLIARGRQRGYSVLLAPQFLLAEGDYGFLEEATGPVRESEPVRSGVATSRRGRRFGLIWAEHRVTAADIGGTTDPHDEHSRPLRLLYGLLSTSATIDADLGLVRRAALDTYRRFLTDEHHFTTEPSTPLDPHATEPSTPLGLRATGPSVPLAPAPLDARPTVAPAPRPTPLWVKALVISAAVVVGATAATVVAITSSGSGAPPPSHVDEPTTSCGTPTPTTTPLPSMTLPDVERPE